MLISLTSPLFKCKVIVLELLWIRLHVIVFNEILIVLKSTVYGIFLATGLNRSDTVISIVNGVRHPPDTVIRWRTLGRTTFGAALSVIGNQKVLAAFET